MAGCVGMSLGFGGFVRMEGRIGRGGGGGGGGVKERGVVVGVELDLMTDGRGKARG